MLVETMAVVAEQETGLFPRPRILSAPPTDQPVLQGVFLKLCNMYFSDFVTGIFLNALSHVGWNGRGHSKVVYMQS